MIGPGVITARTGSSIAAALENHCPTWATAARLASEPGTRIAWSSSVHARGSGCEVRGGVFAPRPTGGDGSENSNVLPCPGLLSRWRCAAVGLDEPAAQGQPDPAARQVLGALLVRLEDPLLVGGVDPGAVVAHRDAHRVRRRRSRSRGPCRRAASTSPRCRGGSTRSGGSAGRPRRRAPRCVGRETWMVTPELAGPAPHEQVGIGDRLRDVDAGEGELQGPVSTLVTSSSSSTSRSRSRPEPAMSST